MTQAPSRQFLAQRLLKLSAKPGRQEEQLFQESPGCKAEKSRNRAEAEIVSLTSHSLPAPSLTRSQLPKATSARVLRQQYFTQSC